MFISFIIFAITLSVDSLGVGITYGVRNICITLKARITLFVISFVTVLLAICFGRSVSQFIPMWFSKIIGGLLISIIGIWIVYQSYNKKSEVSNILISPSISDFDKSGTIDNKEAIILGFALSTDALISGIGFSMTSNFSLIFPFLVSLFQLLFLYCGEFFGSKIKSIISISSAIWSRISGILLILFGIIKIIF